MPRNPRPAWRGTGGRHTAESMAGIGRNTHPSAPEICSRPYSTWPLLRKQTQSLNAPSVTLKTLPVLRSPTHSIGVRQVAARCSLIGY